ncbi:hypothetical protein QBC47DRAFT_368860 [Echria macrotheca]|uniref:Uncharacterized protein n=1 Tax=Echria macrotheca TaxID=438768 RepID=A0AAJ0FHE8_9PEZI|nr:hypothetical protein QBC47DRAFT_368860 [Echria macrotheca]
MVQHNALTSMALGRSPYDDVVQGTGEVDPRAPVQLYDDRGRPVNPETRRINRDLIRAHNEVMQVIGVAEPENSAAEAQAEAARRHQQYEERDAYENRVAAGLHLVHGIASGGLIWGSAGLRGRISIYSRFSQVPFIDLFQQSLQEQSVSSYLYTGLPSYSLALGISNLYHYPAAEALRRVRDRLARFRRYLPPLPNFVPSFSTVCDFGAGYVIYHLRFFAFMQQTGLAPSTAVLPDWRFFVPGSSTSPFFFPPPPRSFSGSEILSWLGRFAWGAWPFLAEYGIHYAKRIIFNAVYSRMPHLRKKRGREANKELPGPRSSPASAAAATPIANEEHPRTGRDIARNESAAGPVPERAPSEGPPPSTARRQSTVSLRGDDFGSDDEEGGGGEIVSATLISFDVEATESTDTTPGMWSAELRPNMSDVRAAGNREPQYRDTALIHMPFTLFNEMVANSVSRMALLPFSSWVRVGWAHTLLVRSGRSLEGLNSLSLLDAFSFSRLENLVVLELADFLLQSELWMAVFMVGQRYKYNDEQWTERVEGEKREKKNSEEERR